MGIAQNNPPPSLPASSSCSSNTLVVLHCYCPPLELITEYSPSNSQTYEPLELIVLLELSGPVGRGKEYN